jgi:hypothetical protein
MSSQAAETEWCVEATLMPVQKVMRWISIAMLAVVLSIWVAVTRRPPVSQTGNSALPRTEAIVNPADSVGLPGPIAAGYFRTVESLGWPVWTEMQQEAELYSADTAAQSSATRMRELSMPYNTTHYEPRGRHMSADIIGLPPEMELDNAK